MGHAHRNNEGSSLCIHELYLGTMGSSTVFLLQTAETNSSVDISKILGEAPAVSQTPESGLITESQFLYLILSRTRSPPGAASTRTLQVDNNLLNSSLILILILIILANY